MQKSQAVTIKDVIKTVLVELEAKSDPKQKGIIDMWAGIVGRNFKNHSRPASIRNRVLFVNVDGSSWLYMLTLKRQAILNDMRKAGIACDKIKDIRFKIGKIKK